MSTPTVKQDIDISKIEDNKKKEFEKYDSDKDGKLNAKQQAIMNYDLDKDGKLNADQQAIMKADQAAAAANAAKSQYQNSLGDAVRNKINTSVEGKQGVNNQYNKIIYQTFKVGGSGRGKADYTKSNQQICDVLDDYKWTIDTFNKFKTYNVNDATNGISGNTDNNLSKVHIANIPHCYMIQYQQKLSSNITNFVNTIVSAVNAINDNDTAESVKDIATNVDKLKNSLLKTITGDNDNEEGNGVTQGASLLFSGVKKGINTLASYTVGKISGNIQNPILNSKYLAPYKLLYDLTATNMRYVFPMVAQPPIIKLTNSYGQKQDSDSILSSNNLIKWFDDVSSGVVSFSRDLKDLGSLMGGASTGYQLSNIEKAKFFNYPTDTEEYTITFPLLNTVKGNSSIPEWQKNYKFIMLFTLRNMVFRRDNASFFPPLFYDLIIPGVIRQPYCYVKQVSVKPLGLTRMLSMNNLFSFIPESSVTVAVPQAWIVTIKLKSLLSTSANMILSGLSDIKIKTDLTSVINSVLKN